jgi:hypothetical protein
MKSTPNERIMDHWAVSKLVDHAGGKRGNQKTKAKLLEELKAVAADLAGPNPSAVETMLAETAATSWFAFRMFEARYSTAATSDDGMTIVQSEHAQRKIDRAHRRLLSTLKTLATVRRLPLPNLQINVARQQVNQLNTGGASCGGLNNGHSFEPCENGSTPMKLAGMPSDSFDS